MKFSMFSKRAIFGIAVAALAACGGDNTGPTGQVQVSSITIDSGSFLLERGTHVTLTATAKDSHGKVVSVPFAWRSSVDTVATFQPDGKLGALDTGITVITASSLGVTSAPIGVRVIWVGAANVSQFQWNPPIAASPGAVVDSIRIQVTNRAGGPAIGAHVTFKTASGTGTLSPATAITNSSGVAAAEWTLGPTESADTVTATVVDDQGTPESWVTGNPAIFALRAFKALTVLQGDGQSGTILSALPVTPSVILVDSTGKPRPGIVVSFIPSNNGTVASPVVSTGADGVASPGAWTLGDTPGAQTLTAKVGIATVALHATGTGTPIHYTPSKVSAGGFATCAINADATASCWGQQPNVGNGGSANVTTPTATAGGVKFTTIAGSPSQVSHFCGVGSDASVYCWGNNALADTSGKNTQSATPTRLGSSLTFTQVSPGSAHACALASNSVVYCWGFNSDGQLGDGTTATRFVPSPVSGGFTFASVVSGTDHSCALTAAGTAFCWGLNGNGQLGDGTTTNRVTPTLVGGGLTFQSLGAGETWTCGLTTAGQAYCWGNLSAANQTQTSPKSYAAASPFSSLSVGGAHACGLTSDGTAFCWGNNTFGQLGDSTTTRRDVPTAVAGGLTFRALSAGYAHTCALAKPDGGVVCWGLNQAGEIGNKTVGSQLTPRFIILGVTP